MINIFYFHCHSSCKRYETLGNEFKRFILFYGFLYKKARRT